MAWNFFNKIGLIQQDLPPDPIPVGLVTPFITQYDPSLSVPVGWLLCDGSTVSSADYPELYERMTNTPAPLSPVSFLLPNLTQSFCVGSGSVFPLHSTDSSVSRSRHNHGGSSGTSHSHTITHTHNYPQHSHDYPHAHSDYHIHTVGTLSVNPVAGAIFNTRANAYDGVGGSTSGAVGPSSVPPDPLNPHFHAIPSSFNYSLEPNIYGTLQYQNFTTGNAAAGTSGSYSSTTNSESPSIDVPASDILPPYLNVYFIVKAEDLSGA